MKSRWTLPLLAAVAGGCVATPSPAPSRAEFNAALQSAARQVRRCYRTPRVSSAGRLIVTRLRVRVTPEGQLAGLPVLVWQTGVTPANRSYAGPMAEAAIAAVVRCAPLRLPPAVHAHGGSEFELTFSPSAVA